MEKGALTFKHVSSFVSVLGVHVIKVSLQQMRLV